MFYDYRKGDLQYSQTQVTYNTDCCGSASNTGVSIWDSATRISSAWPSPCPTLERSEPSSGRNGSF